MSIEDLSERQPHLTVPASDGVHVIPVSLVRDVIAGRQPSSILTEPVLQRIVEEWLGFVSAET
jgi:hypothetical protein